MASEWIPWAVPGAVALVLAGVVVATLLPSPRVLVAPVVSRVAPLLVAPVLVLALHVPSDAHGGWLR